MVNIYSQSYLVSDTEIDADNCKMDTDEVNQVWRSDICYSVSYAELSFSESYVQCGNENKSLVEIHSDDVLQTITDTLNENSDKFVHDIQGFWIGLSHDEYAWSDGKLIIYI